MKSYIHWHRRIHTILLYMRAILQYVDNISKLSKPASLQSCRSNFPCNKNLKCYSHSATAVFPTHRMNSWSFSHHRRDVPVMFPCNNHKLPCINLTPSLVSKYRWLLMVKTVKKSEIHEVFAQGGRCGDRIPICLRLWVHGSTTDVQPQDTRPQITRASYIPKKVKQTAS